MDLVDKLGSGLKAFNVPDNKEYDERKDDPEFWKLVDKATENHEINTKAGLLRWLYHDLNEAETTKDRLPIIKFIYEMSVSNQSNIDNELIVEFK